MAKRFEKAKYYTEKYKNILLPCKHCGNRKIVIASEKSLLGDNKDYWAVCCSTPACDCTGDYTSVRAAVNSWNEMQHNYLGEE